MVRNNAERSSKTSKVQGNGNGLANPAPLGLAAFGMTTVLLNLHNAGILDAFSLGMIFSMGIFYGGLAQVFAGMWEMRKANTFGTLAFTSYGLFWISLVFILVFPTMGWAPPVSKPAMAAYLFMWGLFTFFMFFGTLRTNRVLQFVFLSLTVLFWLLAIGDATNSEIVIRIAGVEGLFCGLAAFYLAMAEVINETNQRTVLPIWPMK